MTNYQDILDELNKGKVKSEQIAPQAKPNQQPEMGDEKTRQAVIASVFTQVKGFTKGLNKDIIQNLVFQFAKEVKPPEPEAPKCYGRGYYNDIH